MITRCYGRTFMCIGFDSCGNTSSSGYSLIDQVYLTSMTVALRIYSIYILGATVMEVIRTWSIRLYLLLLMLLHDVTA